MDVFIDDAPLIPTTKNLLLAHIAGIFFVLLHAGSSPMLTNPEFALYLFHPHRVPDSYFWNKLASPIDHAEVVNCFFEYCENNDNIDFYILWM